MIFDLWMGFEHQSPILGNTIMLFVYFIFGFFQSTGGPVGTAIMGSWFADAESVKNRGTIFGLWTCHQYMGDIAAAICTAIILHLEMNWLLALALPAVCNIGWGFFCLSLGEPRVSSWC